MKITKFIIMFQLVIAQSASGMRPDWELRSEMAREEYHLLVDAVAHQDYKKTMTLLSKDKINPNPPFNDMREALYYAKSKPLAQLLIANGAKIPTYILNAEACQKDEYPSDLLAFYLEKGFKLTSCDQVTHHMELLLHKLSRFPLSDYDASEAMYSLIPESVKDLKNRLEKAQLLLKFGANPLQDIYISRRTSGKSSLSGTAFYDAASKEDLCMCRLLLEHEIIRRPAFVTFLIYCKQNFPRFYAQKDILRLLWNDLAPSRLLALKDSNGKAVLDCSSSLFKSVLKYTIKFPFNLESAMASLEENL